jgi:hypothetical protein
MFERVVIAGRVFAGALCLMLLPGFARPAVAEPVQTIINNGDPANRIDIAILGDGYTSAEMPKYASDVQQFVQGVFQQEPFREYQKFFNVQRIDVVSAESGADHPAISVFKNTAFDATYDCGGIERLICVNQAKVLNVATGSLSPTQRDLIIVIVNDAEYGGSGGSVAVASTNPDAVELILHESGHTFGLLADEYSSSPPTCVNSVEPAEANVTTATARASVKWNAWIDPSTPVPTQTTTPALPGLYVGAKYCTSGLYRPTFNSKMRSLGQPYEQINTEQLVRRIYNTVSPVDSAAPAATTLSLTTAQSQTFTVNTPSPLTHALAVTWAVDGQPSGAVQTTFAVAPGALGVGTHAIEATVRDETALVRSDPEHLLTESVRWSVTVAPANPIDDTSFFVTQHYKDFLNREPDASGLGFWTNEIESCGTNLQCREVKRVNVSAAFFLSIEFQQTGYFVYKTYKAAFGNLQNKPVPLTRAAFLADSRMVASTPAQVVVGQTGWEQQLDANKTAYVQAFVQRPDFLVKYPPGTSASAYVDALFATAGVTPTSTERGDAVTACGAGDAAGRAAALRSVAESQSLQQGEFNRAFVLMQYFGYLQRDPDAAPDSDFSGYSFWLAKLNQFGGNFVSAEMVKAFITSTEYRQRFGP